MALSATRLRTALLARYPATTDGGAGLLALAQEVIAEITANAEVRTTIQGGSVATGVTVGAAAVPVTGTSNGAAGTAIL